MACRRSHVPVTEGTYRVKVTRTRPKIVVIGGGRGVVSHAGARLLADLADATGLTSAFSQALAGLRQRQREHDPGRIAVDVAVMLADGGETIADLAVLREQAALFGRWPRTRPRGGSSPNSTRPPWPSCARPEPRPARSPGPSTPKPAAIYRRRQWPASRCRAWSSTWTPASSSATPTRKRRPEPGRRRSGTCRIRRTQPPGTHGRPCPHRRSR
jgi:hypothetical protein